MKQIQFTKGCPNNCSYCYEPKEMEYFKPEVNVIQKEDLKIVDMNLLANPNHLTIIKQLGMTRAKKELICGVDYRLMTQNIANCLKSCRFIKIRWAWDYNFGQQRKHQVIWKMFKKAGYRSEDLSVFILANWKIPYRDCCKKLDLLKIWNVCVSDCCWNGGYKIAKPVYWTPEQIKKFRAKCRKHNHLIKFKLDPEFK